MKNTLTIEVDLDFIKNVLKVDYKHGPFGNIEFKQPRMYLRKQKKDNKRALVSYDYFKHNKMQPWHYEDYAKFLARSAVYNALTYKRPDDDQKDEEENKEITG